MPTTPTDTDAPVVPAEGLDALLLDLHDLASDAYDNGKEHESNTMIRAYDAITALRSAPPVGARVTVQEAARVLLNDRAAIDRMVETAEDIYATGVSFNVIVGDALRALLPAGEGE